MFTGARSLMYGFMNSSPRLRELTGPAAERRALQVAIGVCGLVPVIAGLLGGRFGLAMLGGFGSPAFDSHYRYLSGLLLGIGVTYWSAIPRVEVQGERIGILTLIVVIGGFCRALGMLAYGFPGWTMVAALAMELIVTPAIFLWQGRVAARATQGAGGAVDAEPAAL
jgi:hypothetical protein